MSKKTKEGRKSKADLVSNRYFKRQFETYYKATFQEGKLVFVTRIQALYQGVSSYMHFDGDPTFIQCRERIEGNSELLDKIWVEITKKEYEQQEETLINYLKYGTPF